MVECPFLTTAEEHVECFNECEFNSASKSSNECPFKSLEKDDGVRRKKSSKYDLKGYNNGELSYYDDLEYEDLDII